MFGVRCSMFDVRSDDRHTARAQYMLDLLFGDMNAGIRNDHQIHKIVGVRQMLAVESFHGHAAVQSLRADVHARPRHAFVTAEIVSPRWGRTP